MTIEIEGIVNVNESVIEGATAFLRDVEPESLNPQWMIDSTEKFCKEKAIYNAIRESIKIIDGRDKLRTNEALPGILAEALSVSFDTNIGHDYYANAEQRYEFQHAEEVRLPFGISLFNKITGGGLPNKTLNCILAGTNVGKSLLMCDWAAHWVSEGYNVLYITMEMAEERIAERIDANMMDVTMYDMKKLSQDSYITKFDKLRAKKHGQLIIKEFPTASAHSGHFRSLLQELNLKKDFRPQVIIIDYLNICASSRMKLGGSVNTYSYIKSIAEELRGLAVEFDVPIVTATQSNRDGLSASDVGLENTSESIGLPATVDFMFAMISTPELVELNQIMIKQLKSRYGDVNYYNKFVIGVDKAKMKFFELEDSAQRDISDSGQNSNKFVGGSNTRGKPKQDADTPLFDRTPSANRGGAGRSNKFVATDKMDFGSGHDDDLPF